MYYLSACFDAGAAGSVAARGDGKETHELFHWTGCIIFTCKQVQTRAW